MNKDKFFKQLQKVRVPYRFSMRIEHIVELAEGLEDKPCELACLAFNFGYLQSQRAAEAEKWKEARARVARHAPGYGLLTTLIERHMSDAEFIKWMLVRARSLDKAYREIEEAAGRKGVTNHAEET